MKKIYLVLVLLSFSVKMVFAQGAAGDNSVLPPNAEPGKCYAKCFKADVYEEQTERIMAQPEKKATTVHPTVYKIITEEVMTKAESKKLILVPAVYETITEQVMVKAESKRLENIPAIFNTETSQVKIKEETKKLIAVPATYKTVMEKVLVRAENQKWVRKKQIGCLSENPDDCIIMCLEKVPAEYKMVPKQELDQPASTREEVVPAVYKTVTKVVTKTPATTKEIIVPAEYKTVTKVVMKTPPSSQEIIIPAVYEKVQKEVVVTPANTTDETIPAVYVNVTKKILKTAGGYGEWKEILCDSKVTSYTIRQIQDALMKKGYAVGVAGNDNIMGKDTREALIKYQKANNLPVGNLNLETLKSLGIQY